MEIDLLCVVCWAQVVFIGISSCGKGFTFRYISGPGKANQRADGLSAGCFWNLLWPTQFSLSFTPLWTSERLYDWLIERQQPREILYHGPGLYFPFLLKFLLTHSPRAFKPKLISFRAPWFDQSNSCAMFRSHFVERQQRQWPSDVILKVRGLLSLQHHLSLQCHSHPDHVDTLDLHNDKCTSWV